MLACAGYIRKNNIPKIVAPFVSASSQGQRTHSVQTNSGLPKLLSWSQTLRSDQCWSKKFPQSVLLCAGREYIFTPVSTWPKTDWSLLSKQRDKCYKILYLCISTPVYLGSVSSAAIDIPVTILPGFRRQTAGTDGLWGWVCTVMVKSNWSAIP